MRHYICFPSCVSDSGLNGDLTEEQGMGGLCSMYTDTMGQAKFSMLPADAGKSTVPQPNTTNAYPTSSASLSSTSSSKLQSSASSSKLDKDKIDQLQSHKSETCLTRDTSQLALKNLDSLNTSKSLHTFTSDTKTQTTSAVVTSKVTSPSASSLQSFTNAALTSTGTDEQAITQNTSSWPIGGSITTGIISPTDDSSEDHAEIERTSTEISPDSIRLEQDILDTRTEDEAPEIDDDLIPGSPVQGQLISDRLLSIEITEDTDITTPYEMRDSQTEKDATGSCLESGEDKDGTDANIDLPKEISSISRSHDLSGDLQNTSKSGKSSVSTSGQEIQEDKNIKEETSDHSNVFLSSKDDTISMNLDHLVKVKSEDIHNFFTLLDHEFKNIEQRIERLKKKIESKEFDSSSAETEALILRSTLNNLEKISKDKVPDDDNYKQNIKKSLLRIEFSLSTVDSMISNTTQSDTLWPTDESRKARRTESTVVETGSTEDGSPTGVKQRDQSLSDLLDSEEIERESLEDDFEKLVAEAEKSPGSVTSLPSDIPDVISPSSPPNQTSPLQPTQREPGMELACDSSHLYHCLSHSHYT